VFLSFTVMRGLGVAENTRWKPFRISDHLHWLRIAGAIMMSAVLVWPKYFYPLVWGATTLLVEPWVYRKSPERSLLHDLEKGDPRRVLRLLAGGVLIGFLWESLNIAARAKWIYTVPGLEDLKLFEMPLLGFLGFPPFTLECFVLWQSFVVAGVALPRDGRRFPATGTVRAAGYTAAIAFCAAVMWQMDRQTVGSYSPQLAAIVGNSAPALQAAGVDVYQLARTDPTFVAGQLSVSNDSATAIIEHARLVTLRGIGTHYADQLNRLGIMTVEDLSRIKPHDLELQWNTKIREPINPARMRIWTKAARHDVARRARAGSN
jgi:predicted flap endonuclease-1-like 5' DNA nuclease